MGPKKTKIVFTFDIDTLLLKLIFKHRQEIYNRGTRSKGWTLILDEFNSIINSSLIQSRTLNNRFKTLRKDINLRITKDLVKADGLNENEKILIYLNDFFSSSSGKLAEKEIKNGLLIMDKKFKIDLNLDLEDPQLTVISTSKSDSNDSQGSNNVNNEINNTNPDTSNNSRRSTNINHETNNVNAIHHSINNINQDIGGDITNNIDDGMHQGINNESGRHITNDVNNGPRNNHNHQSGVNHNTSNISGPLSPKNSPKPTAYQMFQLPYNQMDMSQLSGQQLTNPNNSMQVPTPVINVPPPNHVISTHPVTLQNSGMYQVFSPQNTNSPTSMSNQIIDHSYPDMEKDDNISIDSNTAINNVNNIQGVPGNFEIYNSPRQNNLDYYYQTELKKRKSNGHITKPKKLKTNIPIRPHSNPVLSNQPFQPNQNNHQSAQNHLQSPHPQVISSQQYQHQHQLSQTHPHHSQQHQLQQLSGLPPSKQTIPSDLTTTDKPTPQSIPQSYQPPQDQSNLSNQPNLLPLQPPPIPLLPQDQETYFKQVNQVINNIQQAQMAQTNEFNEFRKEFYAFKYQVGTRLDQILKSLQKD